MKKQWSKGVGVVLYDMVGPILHRFLAKEPSLAFKAPSGSG
jgi:hypothetical protein